MTGGRHKTSMHAPVLRKNIFQKSNAEVDCWKKFKVVTWTPLFKYTTTHCWLWKWFVRKTLHERFRDVCVCLMRLVLQCVMSEFCREITHHTICLCWHLLMATFLKPQAHWLNGSTTVPLSPCLSLPSFLCVSLCLLPRERLRVDSKVHCVSEMFINERGAQREHSCYLKGLIANLFVNTVSLYVQVQIIQKPQERNIWVGVKQGLLVNLSLFLCEFLLRSLSLGLTKEKCLFVHVCVFLLQPNCLVEASE